MLRAYILSLKLLLWISLPISVGTMSLRTNLIEFGGGAAYLPHSAVALTSSDLVFCLLVLLTALRTMY